MSPEYPIQLLHSISDNEFNLTSDLVCTKLLRFQQTAKRGEKFFFSDTGNEYVATNDAGDKHGDITNVEDDTNATIWTSVLLAMQPEVGDTIQIMNSSTGQYVGTHKVLAKDNGWFTLDTPFLTGSETVTGYWKREANLLKVISTKTVESETLTTSTSFVTTEDMLGKVIEINNGANAITITLQDFIDKGVITFILRGTGAVTFDTTLPSTILSESGRKRLINQHCSVTVFYNLTDGTYSLIGKVKA